MPKLNYSATKYVIFMTNWSGHRIDYARYLCDYGLSRSLPMEVYVPNQKTFSQMYSFYGDAIPINIFRFSRVNVIKEVYALLKCQNQILLPDGDKIAAGIGFASFFFLRRPELLKNITAVMIRSEEKNFKASIKKILINKSRKNGMTVLQLLGPFRPNSVPLGYLPDPFPTEIAHNYYELQDGKNRECVTIALLGFVDYRKNPFLVMDSVALARGISRELIIQSPPNGVLALRLQDYAEKLTQADFQLTIRFIQSNLPTKEWLREWRDASVFVCAHSNEGPSGLVGIALGTGRHLIAAGAESLRKDIERVGIGKWVRLNTQEISKALLEINSKPNPKPVSLAHEGEFSQIVFSLEKRGGVND